MDKSVEDLVSVVETWQHRRVELAEGFTVDGLRGFAEQMNGLSRRMISILDKHDPMFFSALFELAQNASTLTTASAKLFVNGKDYTGL